MTCSHVTADVVYADEDEGGIRPKAIQKFFGPGWEVELGGQFAGAAITWSTKRAILVPPPS
jgi:hypothetical protein